MSQKTPKELENGMILADDVQNLDGQTLFKKGLELKERHIEILLMWGVPQVEIEDDSEEPLVNLDQFDPITVANAERFVAKRFALARSSHPAVDIVRNISILEMAKQLKEAKGKS